MCVSANSKTQRRKILKFPTVGKKVIASKYIYTLKSSNALLMKQNQNLFTFYITFCISNLNLQSNL